MRSADQRSAAGTPQGGLRFDQLFRLGAPGAWRPVVGVIALILLVLLAQFVVVTGVGVVMLASGSSGDAVTDQLSGDPVTPLYLAVVNLGWALAIPSVLLVAWAVHRIKPGWATSVVGRIRWRWLLLCLVIAIGTLFVTALVSALLPAQGDAGVEMSGHLNDWTPELRDFLLVVLLLTPLQAAGEEFAFRGYLTQAVGRLGDRAGELGGKVLSVVVPAFLFGLAHGIGQDVPIFFDRFAFGLVAGVLVLMTGGLEAGIAMHVLNNFLAFGLALAFGDMTSALTPTQGTWWSIPVTLTQSLVYLAGCLLAARSLGLARRAEERVLEGGTASV